MAGFGGTCPLTRTLQVLPSTAVRALACSRARHPSSSAMKPSASMVMRPAKATSNAARAAAVASQMLRDHPVQQHREEAGSEDDEPKLDYLTAEDMKRAKQQGQAERAREKAAEAAAERRASPVSKAQQRKLAQIEAKKQKAAAREEVMAVLAARRT